MPPKDPKSLRSYRWFGPDDLRSFGHRSRAASMGCVQADYAGKPIIAIINTWSDINPCHSHLRERAEDVKRGVWQAEGFPVEMPAMTLGETFQKPTTMMYRNLLAMETEELLRSYPADGCVLLGGCDKTTPALLMGAASCDLPSIMVSGGPMLNGKFRGQDIGSGTDVWKLSEEVRRGVQEVEQVSGQLTQIIRQVQALTPQFETVNEGMQSQSIGAQQISEALAQLTESAQQTVESLHQSNIVMDQLNSTANDLRTGVSRFKLKPA